MIATALIALAGVALAIWARVTLGRTPAAHPVHPVTRRPLCKRGPFWLTPAR